jgi:hypothetical protein
LLIDPQDVEAAKNPPPEGTWVGKVAVKPPIPGRVFAEQTKSKGEGKEQAMFFFGHMSQNQACRSWEITTEHACTLHHNFIAAIRFRIFLRRGFSGFL